MRTIRGSTAQFAVLVTLWSTASLGILGFLMTVVARLDFSFFEANGMLRAEFMREALFQQLYLAIDPWAFGVLSLGLLAVAGIAFWFAYAQCAYVRRTRDALQSYAERLEVPSVNGLGPLSMHMADFLEIMHLRIKRDSQEKINEAIEKALRDWPQSPRVSGNDLAQFVVLSVLLATIFSFICATFFIQVANRIEELGRTVARFNTPQGPQFLLEQYELVNLLMWTVIGVTAVAFVSQGYQFGRKLAESNYAILRDLRKFMQGDFNQRLFLRGADPVAEYVPAMNEALNKIQKKL